MSTDVEGSHYRGLPGGHLFGKEACYNSRKHRGQQFSYKRSCGVTPTIENEVIPLRVDESGVVRVGKTRILLDLVVEAFNGGASVEDIVDMYPSLERADVYYAIGYYLKHRPELDAYLQERARRAEEMQHQIIADRDAAKVHRNRRLLLDQLGVVGGATLGRDHLNLADRLDELGLTRVHRSANDHFYRLHTGPPLRCSALYDRCRSERHAGVQYKSPGCSSDHPECYMPRIR